MRQRLLHYLATDTADEQLKISVISSWVRSYCLFQKHVPVGTWPLNPINTIY